MARNKPFEIEQFCGAEPGLHKDRVLDAVAAYGNVAQFVSFGPDLSVRFSRIRGFDSNHRFASLSEAVAVLLKTSPEKSVNVRSYHPERPKSREFVYDVRTEREVVEHVTRLASQSLFTIVNEKIDVKDGGVSGVVVGDLIEFSPGDTPRCVETAGVVSLPRELGIEFLATVYGFQPALDFDPGLRVEFSLHPLVRGFRAEHTILWEIESVGPVASTAQCSWPNNFSRFLGDKAFGLLVAHIHGLPVPKTTVVCRHLAPFQFGSRTGTGEVWLRTCPVEQVPGRFPTLRGWQDPFTLLAKEDPAGEAIVSVLAQEGVDSMFSGALGTTANGSLLLEGTSGSGDAFMVGSKGPETLPTRVVKSIQSMYSAARSQLGPVRMEWAYDGKQTWVLQLHAGIMESAGNVVYPGEPKSFHEFRVEAGLEALRQLTESIKGRSEGIVLVGNVGVTSHFGDVLRRARVPSRIRHVA
ncbi:MAG: hypothetical protein HY000_10910 [Planctomycetes bacterium]|nr:hypothetical protein [Planctomycetota bacterium]